MPSQTDCSTRLKPAPRKRAVDTSLSSRMRATNVRTPRDPSRRAVASPAESSERPRPRFRAWPAMEMPTSTAPSGLTIELNLTDRRGALEPDEQSRRRQGEPLDEPPLVGRRLDPIGLERLSSGHRVVRPVQEQVRVPHGRRSDRDVGTLALRVHDADRGDRVLRIGPSGDDCDEGRQKVVDDRGRVEALDFGKDGRIEAGHQTPLEPGDERKRFKAGRGYRRPQVCERHPVEALAIEPEGLVEFGRAEFAEVALEVLGIEAGMAPREGQRAQRVPSLRAEEGVVVVIHDAARPQEAGHLGEGCRRPLDVLEHLERDDRIEACRLQAGSGDVVLNEVDQPLEQPQRRWQRALGSGRGAPVAWPRSGSTVAPGRWTT